jgi:mono/diheme cytochrome c family protein
VVNFKLVPPVAAALLLAVSVGHTAENEPGYKASAEHGFDLAKRWCSSCHLVSDEQQRASADVPPFAVIAQSPNFNPGRLARFLLDPHPKMPELPLSRAAADDIAAYIGSLKK